MLGAVYLGDREVVLHEYEDPAPGPGEVVLEIRASGMCGSDLHLYRAPRNDAIDFESRTIAGHEPAGVVATVGPGVPQGLARVGQRVMVHHYWGCATCRHCRSGWAQMCTTVPMKLYGGNAHGAHAPLMKVPAGTLVALNEGLSFQAGAAIACGTGTAWGALKRLSVSGDQTLAVFGQGPVGLSATMLGAAMGLRVIALDVENHRLARATEFGAHHTVNPVEEDPVAAIKRLTQGEGAQAVLDTTGATAAASAAIGAVAAWGKVCFVGLGGQVTFDVLGGLQKQLTTFVSWSMSSIGMSECADFIVQRQLPIDKLFTHEWKLGQVAEAYREFDKQASGKGVFLF